MIEWKGKRKRMRKLRILGILLLSVMLIFAVGCTKKDSKTDNEVNTGTEQGEQLEGQYPQRIVSIIPSMTEVLFDLGLENQIVGVTANCDFPLEAATKPVVGDWVINMESLLALEPDLVVGTPSMNGATLDEIEKLGIPTLAMEAQTIEEIYELYLMVGEATGTKEKADTLVAEMKAKLQAVENKVNTIDTVNRLHVFMEIGFDPLYTISKGSLQHELLTHAGGSNVVQADMPWVEYGIESVLMDNPDAIIITHPMTTALELKARSGYDQLNAVQQDRITDAIDPNILVRPTKRAIDGIEQIAKFLYPELFTN